MSNRLVLDLNMGTAHLMDIIEGPAGYGADSLLLRYQAPCTDEDQIVEGDQPLMRAAAAAPAIGQHQQQDENQPELPPLMDDDTVTIKSTSTAGSLTSSTASVANDLVGSAAHNHLREAEGGAYPRLFYQQQQERANIRRRQCQHDRQKRRQQVLDDRIWFVVTSLERRRKLFSAIRSSAELDSSSSRPLKALKHISIRFVGCTFPAPALASLLKHAVPLLETLQLRVTLAGPLDELGQALQYHKHLSQVTLDHCLPAIPEVMRASSDGLSSSRSSMRRQPEHPPFDDDDEEYRLIDKSSCNKTSVDKRKSPPPLLASLEPLLDALAESKSLRSLILSHCTIAFTVTHTSSPLMEGLQDVQQQSNTSAWNAGASLSHFLRRSASRENGSLSKLSLEHMTEIRDEDFATILSVLEGDKSSYLRTLSIRQCKVGPKAGQALGRMLSTNTCLRTLDVNIHWWDGISYKETPQGQYEAQYWETDVVSLVNGLSTNAHLQCLGLYCDNVAYSHSAAVVSILGDSVEASVRRLCDLTLQELPKIFQPSTKAKLTSPTQASESILPSENRCLEDIIVGHRSFGLSPEIDFYLNWNRAGRDYFSIDDSTATTDDWVDALLTHRNDLSVIYALVSMNPAMFPHEMLTDKRNLFRS